MKIGWILSGNREVAGARIQGWNMHDRLLKKGYDSRIIFAPQGFVKQFSLTKDEIDAIDDFDVIIIQKLYDGENLEYFLSKTKAKIIYVCMDKINEKLSARANAILAVSDNLLKNLPNTKTTYVFDGYEQEVARVKQPTNDKKISLVYLSNNVYDSFPQIESLPQNVSLTIIGPPVRRVKKYNSSSKIFAETKYTFNYIEWSETTVTDEILKADVAVIPYPDELLNLDAIKNKSNNRFIFFASLGLPVIASPLFEFEKLIVQGQTGFIAKTTEQWQDIIIQLRDNPSLRAKIGAAARKSVINYSVENQAELYHQLLQKLN